MKRLLLSPMAVVLVLCPLNVIAQNPDEPPAEVFRQLFPNPTGQNGYEELVRAGDAIRNSAAWRDMEPRMGALTLAEQRRLMSDPEVKKALNLLIFGIGKQVTTPHKNGDDETIFPELARFRSLARLVSIEMYVQLADGKMSQAIDTLADTLRFGYVIQTDSIIGGLVGIAVDAIGMKMISNHLDQLSSRDCDRLITLTERWLDLPDPLIGLIGSEKEMGRRILQKYKNQSEKFFETLKPGNPTGPEAQRIDALQRSFKDNPGATGPVFDQAAEKLGAFYDNAIENMKKPVWLRGDTEKLPQDNSPASEIVNLLASTVNLVSDRFGQEQARVQILGVHAAIRRYRWEYNHLPASLAELKLGRLVIDPFTGQALNYKRIDDKTYELSSIGPIDRSEDAAPGTRMPIK